MWTHRCTPGVLVSLLTLYSSTISASEQGKNPPFEHVAKSRAIQMEQGVAPRDAWPTDAGVGKALPASAGGKRGEGGGGVGSGVRKAEFESERLAQLNDRIHEVDPVIEAVRDKETNEMNGGKRYFRRDN